MYAEQYSLISDELNQYLDPAYIKMYEDLQDNYGYNMIIGDPGCGTLFAQKIMLLQALTHENERIIVLDPDDEFSSICCFFRADDVSVSDFLNSAKLHGKSRVIRLFLSTEEREYPCNEVNKMLTRVYYKLLDTEGNNGSWLFLNRVDVLYSLRLEANKASGMIESLFARLSTAKNHISLRLARADDLIEFGEGFYEFMIKNSRSCYLMASHFTDYKFAIRVFGITVADLKYLTTCEPGVGMVLLSGRRKTMALKIPTHATSYQLMCRKYGDIGR